MLLCILMPSLLKPFNILPTSSQIQALQIFEKATSLRPAIVFLPEMIRTYYKAGWIIDKPSAFNRLWTPVIALEAFSSLLRPQNKQF